MANIHCVGPRKSHRIPTTIAAKAPAINCPGVPMLNSPVLNANPTERPVKIIGVA